MQKIPETFCPAKWDELYVNFETNYAYSCCRSAPTKFTDNVLEFINVERQHILNGIQDPSCEYCWKIERSGGKSLRKTILEKFDKSEFVKYQNTPAPKTIQVSVGNECNFQCTYCNPKFSSKWEQDVRKKEYKSFSDRYFWLVEEKNSNVMEKNIEFLQSFEHIEEFSIGGGGEPLLNKKTFELIDSVNAKNFLVTTNLSCKRETIDKILECSSRFELFNLTISLDATGKIAEFTRYGLDFGLIDDNINYILKNKPSNMKITINSVMNSLTIRDLDNFSRYMDTLLNYENVMWDIVYCVNPKTQSLATLPDKYKEKIIKTIVTLTKQSNIIGAESLLSAVTNTDFNKVLHQQMQHFMQEFASRKNIEIPICLD